MIDLAVHEGSSFVVLGLARSGLATARALTAAGVGCIAWADHAASSMFSEGRSQGCTPRLRLCTNRWVECPSKRLKRRSSSISQYQSEDSSARLRKRSSLSRRAVSISTRSVMSRCSDRKWLTWPVAVVMGTTLGMMIANVPAVLLGDRIAARMPVKLVHGIAAAIFLGLGIATLAGAGESLGI